MRSAFGHRKRVHGIVNDARAEKDLKDGIVGIKKHVAGLCGRGEGKAQSGMAPTSWELYMKILHWMLYYIGGSEGIFAYCECVLTFNLCCRTSNTAYIHLGHLEVWQDSLQIYFAHMKNDQGREQAQYAHHVYCIPRDSLVCPIRAISLYFLAFPALLTDRSGYLFTGKCPSGRFGNVLAKIKVMFKSEIEVTGMKLDHPGVHPLHKGGLAFLSSGSMTGPSSSTVHTWAGWSRKGLVTAMLFDCCVD
jgi:hypothetical protein